LFPGLSAVSHSLLKVYLCQWVLERKGKLWLSKRHWSGKSMTSFFWISYCRLQNFYQSIWVKGEASPLHAVKPCSWKQC
jgi:hypothetical protein